MGIKLDHVVPWGRSLDEYIAMFGLTPHDMKRSILDCAGGPASFNAEMTRRGHRVISCDPVYGFTVEEISSRIKDTYQIMVEGVQANREGYVWTHIQSPEHMGEVRMAAMRQFLDDFPNGLREGRYLIAQLPVLPFARQQFDLALCSHFLFTYSDHFNLDFHLASLIELCRVAREVRVFPLLKTTGEPSDWLQPAVEHLGKLGYEAQITRVNYEFQKDANQYLVIK